MQTPIVISEPTSFSFMLQDRLLTSFDQFDRLVVFYLFVCFTLQLVCVTSISVFLFIYLLMIDVVVLFFKFTPIYRRSTCLLFDLVDFSLLLSAFVTIFHLFLN